MIELFNVTSNTQDKAIDIPYLVLPNVGMIALVGPKDSGKSILLKVIAGIDSYKGKIIINQGLKHKKYTCNIGYLDFHTQRRFKTDNYIKALENTAMIYGIKNINKAIENSTKCLAEYSKRIFSTFSSYFLSKLEYNSSKRITGRSKESKIDNENRVFLALSRFS